MAREAKLGPDWLTSLLVCWGRQRLDEASRGKGYYTINPMLKDDIPQPARSYEPTGFSWQDYSDLEKAVGELETLQQLAIARYCMPWRIKMIDLEHDHIDTRRWLALLRQSLVALDVALSRKAA